MQLAKDGSGYLDVGELKQALEIVGFKIPQWQVRQMIDDMESERGGNRKEKLSFDEFQKVNISIFISINVIDFPPSHIKSLDSMVCTLKV